MAKRESPKKQASGAGAYRTDKTGKEKIRLNKFIAESGLTSRRKADELIARGAVKVNGKRVAELGVKVSPSDFVTVNGDPVKNITHHYKYILLNKPKDCIATTQDELGRATVLDYVKSKERIYPVGRLDRNTTGVILLTNDGSLANRLAHPSYQVERVYNVGLDKNLAFEHAKQIAQGVELDDGMTSPCHVFIHPDDNKLVTLTLTEGRYREIRRIFEKFGYEVKKLDRKIFAGISNSGLKRGQFRHLSKNEIIGLKKLAGLL